MSGKASPAYTKNPHEIAAIAAEGGKEITLDKAQEIAGINDKLVAAAAFAESVKQARGAVGKQDFKPEHVDGDQKVAAAGGKTQTTGPQVG